MAEWKTLFGHFPVRAPSLSLVDAGVVAEVLVDVVDLGEVVQAERWSHPIAGKHRGAESQARIVWVGGGKEV